LEIDMRIVSRTAAAATRPETSGIYSNLDGTLAPFCMDLEDFVALVDEAEDELDELSIQGRGWHHVEL